MPSQQPPLFLATMLATLFVGTALFLLQTSYLDSLRGAARHQRDGYHDRSGGSTWIRRRKVKLLDDDKVDIYAHPIGKLIPVHCWKLSDTQVLPGTECYRMPAPLDYKNASDHRRASIALSRYPAGGGNTTQDQVLGTVILNTGGPGSSGIDDLPYLGVALDEFLDHRYHIAAWDPRAIGRTRPQAQCIASYQQVYISMVFSAGEDLHHASSGAIPRQIADARYISEACYEAQAEELRYVSSTSTAKDMRLMYKAFGDDRLNFMGFSYGTALGAYFADMFPDEVGRFYLTGVLNSHLWKLGSPGYDLSDTETSLDEFFAGCVRAGKDGCALLELLSKEQLGLSRAQQAHLLRAKVYGKIEALRLQPEPIPTSQRDPLATYASLKLAIYTILTSPNDWPAFATLLTQGLGSNQWTDFYDNFGMVPPFPDYKTKEEALEARKSNSRGENPAIECSDSLIHSQPVSVKKIEALIHQAEKTSPFAGEIRHGEGETCHSAWKIRGVDVWDGPFNSKTITPILWGSMDSDSITPLSQARNMTKSFPGSRLVVMKGGYGHTTLSMPSSCVVGVLRRYFILGKLPVDDDEIHCRPDGTTYDLHGKNKKLAREEEDEGARRIGQQLSRAWSGLHSQKMRQRKWGRGVRTIF